MKSAMVATAINYMYIVHVYVCIQYMYRYQYLQSNEYHISYQLTIVICLYKSKVLIGNYLFISWRILCVNTSECAVDFIGYAMPDNETIDDDVPV